MGQVVNKLAKDVGALHIPTQQIFDRAALQTTLEHWIWDGIHPLPQGDELIARAWLDVLSAK